MRLAFAFLPEDPPECHTDETCEGQPDDQCCGNPGVPGETHPLESMKGRSVGKGRAGEAPNRRVSAVQRAAGATFVLAGALLLAADGPRWDVVIVTVAPGHGVDLSDVVGAVAVLIGVVALWKAPSRDRLGR